MQHKQKNIGIVGILNIKDRKKNMKTACIRHSILLVKSIKKVAVLGGSGSFAIGHAISANADAYITSDVKYHEFFKAENKLIITDIGHYESEQFTKNLLVDILTKKFPNFAIILSQKNTNPIIPSNANCDKKRPIAISLSAFELYITRVLFPELPPLALIFGFFFGFFCWLVAIGGI